MTLEGDDEGGGVSGIVSDVSWSGPTSGEEKKPRPLHPIETTTKNNI